MKFIYRLLFFIRLFIINTNVCISNTEIIGIEYWFDKDYTNKVYQPISNFSGVLNTDISTLNLEAGIHGLHFRLLDNENKWSAVSSQYFNLNLPDNSNTIVYAEYWFDKSHSLSQNLNYTPQSVVSSNSPIDASDLSNSIHDLHYRFKDQFGYWSAVRSASVNKNTTSEKYITKLEYWFDANYLNNYTSTLTIADNPNFNYNINLNPLTGGCHSLKYRYQDSEGIWSSVLGSSSFCILNLSLKAFIQGYYLSDETMTPALYNCGFTDDMNGCDSITVELRQNAYPYNAVYQNTGLIDVNGNTSFALPESVLNNSYYIVLKHRNAIETWSKYPVILNSSITNFNFTR